MTLAPYDVRVAALACVDSYERPGWEAAEAELVRRWLRWRADRVLDGEIIVCLDRVLTLMWWSQTEVRVHVQEAVAVFRHGPVSRKRAVRGRGRGG